MAAADHRGGCLWGTQVAHVICIVIWTITLIKSRARHLIRSADAQQWQLTFKLLWNYPRVIWITRSVAWAPFRESGNTQGEAVKCPWRHLCSGSWRHPRNISSICLAVLQNGFLAHPRCPVCQGGLTEQGRRARWVQSLKPGFLLLEVTILFPSWYLRLCGALTQKGEEWALGRCGRCQGCGERAFSSLYYAGI